ncbi:MAG: hypothetical protein ACP5UG_07170, partial [Thermoplasmata archaeon]
MTGFVIAPTVTDFVIVLILIGFVILDTATVPEFMLTLTGFVIAPTVTAFVIVFILTGFVM